MKYTVSRGTCAPIGTGRSGHALVMVNSVSGTSSLPVADADTTTRARLHLLFTRNTARCCTPCASRRPWRTPAHCWSGAEARQGTAPRTRRRQPAEETLLLVTSGAAVRTRILC